MAKKPDDDLSKLASKLRELRPNAPQEIIGQAARAALALLGRDDATSQVRPRPPWSERTGDDLALTLPEFILLYFQKERADGTFTMATLRQDRVLYRDFFNYKRHHKLPPELQNIPTKSALNTKWLAEKGTPARSEDIGLYEAARYRAKPNRPASGSRRKKTKGKKHD